MVDQIEELIFEIQATHTVNDTHMVSYDDLRSDNSKKLIKQISSTIFSLDIVKSQLSMFVHQMT